MSSFKPLQSKRALLSTPAAPTSSLLQPSRALVPTSSPASEPVAPTTQEQPERAARLGHSFERISIFPLDRLPKDAKSQEEDTSVIRQAAQEGIRTPSTALPFLERIQRSFGQHEISRIQVHMGQQATASARTMRAAAYTTGNHVVFAGRPALHTAAHEAAHVVQQRGQIQLADGIGKVGDNYEQHADAVANRVVAGQSAGDLLDQFAGEQDETHDRMLPLYRISQPSSSRKAFQIQRVSVTLTYEEEESKSEGEEEEEEENATLKVSNFDRTGLPTGAHASPNLLFQEQIVTAVNGQTSVVAITNLLRLFKYAITDPGFDENNLTKEGKNAYDYYKTIDKGDVEDIKSYRRLDTAQQLAMHYIWLRNSLPSAILGDVSGRKVRGEISEAEVRNKLRQIHNSVTESYQTVAYAKGINSLLDQQSIAGAKLEKQTRNQLYVRHIIDVFNAFPLKKAAYIEKVINILRTNSDISFLGAFSKSDILNDSRLKDLIAEKKSEEEEMEVVEESSGESETESPKVKPKRRKVEKVGR